MTAELVVWLVSLAAVFLVGWAFGRSGRRVVVVNFPERPALNTLRPTATEVRVKQVAEAIFLADRAHFGHALREWAARGESEQRYWCDLATAAMAAVDDYRDQQR